MISGAAADFRIPHAENGGPDWGWRRRDDVG
jgi:hypothetical protein